MQQHTYYATTRTAQLLADTITPVELYLRLRDVFAESILLETSDYYPEHQYSYICCQPTASYTMESGVATMRFPDGAIHTTEAETREQVCASLQQFADAFIAPTDTLATPFVRDGLFGYIGYDAAQAFAGVPMQPCRDSNRSIPAICFRTYRFVLVFDHRKHMLSIHEHTYSGVRELLPVPL